MFSLLEGGNRAGRGPSFRHAACCVCNTVACKLRARSQSFIFMPLCSNYYTSGHVTQAVSRIRLHRQPKVLTLLSLWVLGLLAMWLPAPQTIDAPALQHYEEKLDEAAAGDHAHSLAMQVTFGCSCRLVLSKQGLSVSCLCGSLRHYRAAVVKRPRGCLPQAWWQAQAELEEQQTWFWFLVRLKPCAAEYLAWYCVSNVLHDS